MNMRSRSALAAFSLACALGCLACGQEKSRPESLFLSTKGMPSETYVWAEKALKAQEPDSGIRNPRLVRVNASLLRTLQETEDKPVRFQLFQGEEIRAVVTKRDRRSSVSGSDGPKVWALEGRVEYPYDGSFTFTAVGDRVRGEVRTPRGVYEVRPGPERRDLLFHVVGEVKDDDLPACDSHELAPPKKKATEELTHAPKVKNRP
jgi:hypothetical protein